MSRRMSYDTYRERPGRPQRALTIGEFIESEPAHFEVHTIPYPPEAIRRVVRNREDVRPYGVASVSEYVEMFFGCPHCHKDVEFRWETQRISKTILNQLIQMLHDVRSLEFQLVSLKLGIGDKIRPLTEVCEKLLEALRWP